MGMSEPCGRAPMTGMPSLTDATCTGMKEAGGGDHADQRPSGGGRQDWTALKEKRGYGAWARDKASQTQHRGSLVSGPKTSSSRPKKEEP